MPKEQKIDAKLLKGDPRLPGEDIDNWFNEILTSVSSPKVRPWLYGSDAGLCARKNVYLQWNEWVPDVKKATTVAYMAIGVGLEDMLATALRSKGRLLAHGLRIQELPGLKISGIIDLVILDHQNEVSLIEVKTCGQLPVEPKPEHKAQIQIYCAVSGITKAWITYISRSVRKGYTDKLEMRSFVVDCSEEVLLDRLKIASVSKRASLVKKVPPVPSHFRKHQECHYCQFMDFCWDTREGRGSLKAFSPLEELTTEEYLKIDMEAHEQALSFMKELFIRKEKTLVELLGLDLEEDQKAIVLKEIDKGYIRTP